MTSHISVAYQLLFYCWYKKNKNEKKQIISERVCFCSCRGTWSIMVKQQRAGTGIGSRSWEITFAITILKQIAKSEMKLDWVYVPSNTSHGLQWILSSHKDKLSVPIPPECHKMCSNIWAYGGTFSFKPPQVAYLPPRWINNAILLLSVIQSLY